MRTNETNTGVRRNFDNCKVRIPDEETSKKVQERLFELGYVWNSGFKDVLNLYYNKEFWVNMNEGKTLTHSPTEHTDPEYNEVSVADILGLETVGFIPGTFTWAVDMMKQGKKVYLPEFSKGLFIFISGNDFFYGDLQTYYGPCLSHIEATDWEIYEEPKKTLWDKAKGDHPNPKLNTYTVTTDDVKEHFKELFKIYWNDSNSECNKLKEVVKKVFGKELVE